MSPVVRGATRTPWCPTTISIPLRTSANRTVRAISARDRTECAVSIGCVDFELFAADAHEGLLIRLSRKNRPEKFRRSDAGASWASLFFGDFSAMLPQAQDQIIERFTQFRRYFNPRKTLVGYTFLSDFNLLRS